ncbi:hypothetical protein MMC20_007102 [Loxospora ochrophaea]|nr:hypothetical protein [Loxospora ochrophaea]
MSTFSQTSFEDKAFDLSPKIADHPFDESLFDQYFCNDSSDSNKIFSESHFFKDVDFSQGLDSITNGSYTTDSLSTNSSTKLPERDETRSGLWPLQPKPSSTPQNCNRSIRHTRSDGRVISSTEILKLQSKSQTRANGVSTRSSDLSTPPATPTTTPPRLRRRGNQSIANANTPRRNDLRISKSQPSIRTNSPKMMSPSYFNKFDSPTIDEWTQRFQNFSFQLPPNNSPLSPPPSTKLTQHDRSTRHVLSHATPTGLPSPPPFPPLHQAPRRRQQMPSENVAPLQRASTWLPDPAPDQSFISPPQVHRWSTESLQMPRRQSQALQYYTRAQEEQQQQQEQLSQQQQQDQDQDQNTALPPDLFDLATQGLLIDIDPTTLTSDPYAPLFSDPPSTPLLAPSYPLDPLTNPFPPPLPPSGPYLPTPPKPLLRRKPPFPPPATATATATSSHSSSFINFTPSDSRKILTGVAPSGSSKTKARREREAWEKRRRLSVKAVERVREAGGRWEGLEDELEV